MTFESGVVPKDWRSAVSVSLYKGKGKGLNARTRGISFLSEVGKMHARVLVDRVRKVIKNLINDDKGGL